VYPELSLPLGMSKTQKLRAQKKSEPGCVENSDLQKPQSLGYTYQKLENSHP